MPNLNQIYALKQEFYQLNPRDQRVKDYIEKSEARDVLRKSFNPERLNESRGETVRLFAFINESLNIGGRPELIRYFEEAVAQDVALVFVDITSFSKTIRSWTNARIKDYLDAYYSEIIPLIYEHGGEIEKLMGDGIIIVFGRPFLDLNTPEYVYKAEEFSEDVIKKFHGTDKNVKVAIHKGSINYYKVPGENYSEYTMIGQPITDIYRLESVSKPNAINFYSGSTYDNLGWTYSIFDGTKVSCRGFDVDSLQGVDYTEIKYIQFPGFI